MAIGGRGSSVEQASCIERVHARSMERLELRVRVHAKSFHQRHVAIGVELCVLHRALDIARLGQTVVATLTVWTASAVDTLESILQMTGCAMVNGREMELVGLSPTVAASRCSRADPYVRTTVSNDGVVIAVCTGVRALVAGVQRILEVAAGWALRITATPLCDVEGAFTVDHL